jgi:vacuolar-type H+-ATPase subunit E/Vma4
LQPQICSTIHIKRYRFFRLKLLTVKPEAVQKYIENLETEVEGIRKSALAQAWYMRGGATYEDVLNMCSAEREIINKIIDEHLETTKKTQLPFF